MRAGRARDAAGAANPLYIGVTAEGVRVEDGNGDTVGTVSNRYRQDEE